MHLWTGGGSSILKMRVTFDPVGTTGSPSSSRWLAAHVQDSLTASDHLNKW